MNPSIKQCLAIATALLLVAACKKGQPLPVSPYFDQADQMARPAINTVFIGAADKDKFNVTIPTQMPATFGAEMKASLLALNPGYTTNLIGLTSDQFIGVLSTDMLNASTTGVTSFYNGTQVLTGRTLSD